MLKDAEYLRCEIEHTGRREMITRLEDFLRRRSKISQVVREESLRESPGLLDACRVFFGDDAERKLDEYWATRRPKEHATTGQRASPVSSENSGDGDS